MLGPLKIYKGSTIHWDDRPNHFFKSASGLQKGENDAPLWIHLALILGSKASISQTWTQRWHVLVFPGIMSGISPESQPTH